MEAVTAYDEDKAFLRVIQACRAAEAKGWQIRAGGFLDLAGKTCCPVGAFAVEQGYRRNLSQLDNLDNAFRRFRDDLGLERLEEYDFYRVIDGSTIPRTRAAALARRVRAALWGDA